MPTFSRRTHCSASLDDVWAFHSTIDGLTAITPSLVDLVVEDLSVPDGGQTLLEGTEMVLSVRPIPGGPRVGMATEIVERTRGEGEACFVDELQSGPLRTWRHTHRFVAEDGGTALIDRVEFETGYGPIADAVFALGLRLAFRDRHRRTCETLAGT